MLCATDPPIPTERILQDVIAFLRRDVSRRPAAARPLGTSAHEVSRAVLRVHSHAIADELREMQLGRVLSCEYRPRLQGVIIPVAESFRAAPEAAAT